MSSTYTARQRSRVKSAMSIFCGLKLTTGTQHHGYAGGEDDAGDGDDDDDDDDDDGLTWHV